MVLRSADKYLVCTAQWFLALSSRHASISVVTSAIESNQS